MGYTFIELGDWNADISETLVIFDGSCPPLTDKKAGKTDFPHIWYYRANRNLPAGRQVSTV
jgi:hypothetical protein